MSSESPHTGTDTPTEISPSAQFDDPDGIVIGCSELDQHPVRLDHFDGRWNSLIVGGMGASKAASSKNQIRQLVTNRDDIQVIVVDVVDEFKNITWELDGRHIAVTPRTSINPLELRSPAAHDTLSADIDPLTDAISRGVQWVETFVTERHGESLSDAQRGVLTAVIRRAYENRGISHCVETHGSSSVTIEDVVPELSNVAHDPLGIDDIEGDDGRITDAATDLLSLLSPLYGNGADAHFSTTTDVCALAGGRITRFDVSKVHSTAKLRLLLEGLLGSIFEQAKTTTDDVLVVVDQGHLLCETAFESVETVLRMGRHYGISMQLIAESIESVANAPHDTTLADHCSVVQIHRTAESLSPLGVDLSPEYRQRIRTAQVRTPTTDHLEAVVDVDGTTVPIRIETDHLAADPTEESL